MFIYFFHPNNQFKSKSMRMCVFILVYYEIPVYFFNQAWREWFSQIEDILITTVKLTYYST